MQKPLGSFSGFDPKVISFFFELAANNTKQWFNNHKEDFDNYIIEPAKSFVVDMGTQLHKSISPNIIADPAINRSIFRIYKDTRFSKDKSPYKTHLGILFWEGPLAKMENSGFYFHLEPPNLMIGAGLYCFSKEALDLFRQSVMNEKYGKSLIEAITSLRDAGYSIHGKHYKRVPAGFDKNHPNADYLLYNGLTAIKEWGIIDELFSDKLIDFCLSHFTAMAPLHHWLCEMNSRIKKNE